MEVNSKNEWEGVLFMRTYTKMTPLTPEEREFAEKNHPAVLWYIKEAKLEPEEYYDVVVMGYLKAVKKWFERPDLHKYSFLKIAKMTMRGYVGCERKKQDRRIKTVSLDAIVAGTDGVTRQETITYENMIYEMEAI